MASITINKYIDYFELIAVKNKKILHNANADDPNTAAGESYFALFDLADVFTQLKTALGRERVALLLNPYEIKGDNRNTLDSKAKYTGGFAVVQKATKNEIASQKQAREITEACMWEIINKIIADSNPVRGNPCESPFGFLQLDDFSIVDLGPIWENHYGWHVSFDFRISVADFLDKSKLPMAFNP